MMAGDELYDDDVTSGIRPVDRVSPRVRGFLHSRIEALRMGCCIRCGLDVDPHLDHADLAEYRISALCPDCFLAIFPDEEEA